MMAIASTDHNTAAGMVE